MMTKISLICPSLKLALAFRRVSSNDYPLLQIYFSEIIITCIRIIDTMTMNVP